MKIIKTLTILFFVSSIIVFVKLNTGGKQEIKISKDVSLQLSPNGGALNLFHRKIKKERYISIDTVFIDSIQAKRRVAFYSQLRTFKTPKGDYYYLIKKDSKGRILQDSFTHHALMRSSKVMILTERVIIKDSLYYRKPK